MKFIHMSLINVHCANPFNYLQIEKIERRHNFCHGFVIWSNKLFHLKNFFIEQSKANF